MKLKATFESVWDGGTILASSCEVDTETREISNIEVVDCGSVCCLDAEYVIINGKRFKACYEDDVMNETDFWYS